MPEPTREELDGFGRRLNGLETAHAACAAVTVSSIQNVVLRQTEQRNDIGKLFDKLELVQGKISAIGGRLLGTGIALSLLIPLLTALVMRLLDKGAP